MQKLFGNTILHEEESAFNGKLTVMKNLSYGTFILGGGLTQSGGAAEIIWRASLGEIKNKRFRATSAFVFGFGGGSIAKILEEWWKNIKIEGVDIDPVIVRLGQKYLARTSAQVVIEDAKIYLDKLTKSKKKYDLVLVDMYKGDTVPSEFEQKVFLEKVSSITNKNGFAIFNRLYYGEKRPIAMKFLKLLESIFGEVDPIFTEGNVMFIAKK